MRYSEAFVALGSAQFSKTVQFYAILLDQQPEPFLPDRYAEWILQGGLKLSIFSPKTSHQAEFQTDKVGGFSLCLEVLNLEDAIASLIKLGYPPPGTIHTAAHGREVYAYDPDGNRLILHQRQ